MSQSLSMTVAGKPEPIYDQLLEELQSSPLFDVLHQSRTQWALEVKQRTLVVLSCQFRCQLMEEPGGRTQIRISATGSSLVPAGKVQEQLEMLKERIAILFGADLSGILTGERPLSADIGDLPDLPTLAQAIIAKGTIEAAEHKALAQYIYQKGGVEDDEIELLFSVNAALREKTPEWILFFVNTVSDYFFWRKGGAGTSLSEEEEKKLIALIHGDGRVDEATEMRVLLTVMERVKGTSAYFHNYVLRTVAHSVLHSAEKVYSSAPREPGIIDQDDVTALRKVLYAPGSDGEIRINQEEAELLLELEQKTAGKPNHPSWSDLYTKALAMFLLYKGDSPDAIDLEEAAWLKARINPPGQLTPNQTQLLQYLQQETKFFPKNLQEYLPQA